ncbi:hypothetical protein D3C76_525140 [compost metagenome]|uniref:Membrane-anchored ribosome-binding protein, inhibits growth in stationary phase, ElaB/YqjD/DUF883 family n=1 Tax=Pseudomonas jinjuensis TaxID=198616 RepID=A0A1H0LHL8_9PSED|nr:DUF883 family protein [Pseudomonas jinjuensis]SDO67420.1 Membrane-anchored ribosome-binding protein, inhibits growth in stationary phase, ElaB/YqjD/DUF883 family [Pseudomonas jinjuensis]
MLFSSRNHHELANIQGKTVAELQSLIDEMDHLLKSGRHLAAEEIPQVRDRLGHLLHDGRHLLNRTQRNLSRQSRQAVHATGEYVGEHPWQVALLAGLACGVLACVLLYRR